MIHDVIMPQLAMGMSEGAIAEWIAKEGERLSREQPMVSVETEKVITELPAPYAGFVHLIVGTGAKVPVETLIAQIADTEAEYARLVGAASSERREPAAPLAAASAVTPALGHQGTTGRIRVSGLAR